MTRKKKAPPAPVLDESLENFYHDSYIHSKKSVLKLAARQAKKQPPGVFVMRSKAEEQEEHDAQEEKRAALRRGGGGKQSKEALRRPAAAERQASDKGLLAASRQQWTRGVAGAGVEALLREAEEADRLSALALKEAEDAVEKAVRSRSSAGGGSRRSRVSSTRSHHLGIRREEGVGEATFLQGGQRREAPGEEGGWQARDPLGSRGGGGHGFLPRGGTPAPSSRLNPRGGLSRPHSAMDGMLSVPSAMDQEPQARPRGLLDGLGASTPKYVGNWIDEILGPPDPLTKIPFAVPLRGNSASLASRLPKKPPPRPQSAQPFQFTKPIKPDMSLEQKVEAMVDVGTYYHRQRSDITSSKQMRAGYGKTKEWDLKILEKHTDPRPRGIQDFADKKRAQAAMHREIEEAAALRPKPAPITFEPQHTALPAWHGTGNEWVYHNVYHPKTLSKWGPGNADPRPVNVLATKPSWVPLANGN